MVSMMNDKNTFLHVANNLAVDFTNTQYMNQGVIAEMLTSMEDVYQWANESGITLKKEFSSIAMEDIWQFRSSIKQLLTSYVDEQALSEEALAVVNQQLKNAPLQQQLKVVEQELILQPLDQALSIAQLLGKIADEAANLLASSQIKQLKRCSNEKCILMFVDTSRAKRRRWCSMESCGNRAKAASFYQANK
ncbi:putative RNA-binding Zn ribbon-like protein [Marinomonas pollencensis]|uniref:Putative RNA-binding Zn ribbon-like protein n=2 Tax=Marinomonas pollencensis TaxID=491954 RepID=A0A3E0DQY0_9GAMM|nr:putative RNA-binding Zn ribbon-like protein [Marinomonas pollencensis]